MLQSDNGREYCNREFDIYLEQCGIRRRLSAPHTPQQNGVSERKNRTLLEMARCILRQADAPPKFWAEAINTACYVSNRCPTKSLNSEIPYKIYVIYYDQTQFVNCFFNFLNSAGFFGK